jgi:TonB family protein
VLVEHRAEDRRRHDRQILQAFIITMAGFWLTVFLVFLTVMPLLGPGIWPLLELPFAATGQKAPDKEHDVWVSVRANGQIFVDEKKVAGSELILPKEAGRSVFVRVDRAAPFGAVRAVVRAAQQTGRRKLTFMAAVSNPETIPEPLPLPCGDAGVLPPVVEHRVMPDFSELRQRYRVSGPAILDLSIDRDGKVASIRLVRGIHPTIDAAIVKAVSAWTFRPAMLDGRPVACVYSLRVMIDVR